MMTGGMVIIGHGTSVQYAVGVLILLVQLLLTLKLAPYKETATIGALSLRIWRRC